MISPCPCRRWSELWPRVAWPWGFQRRRRSWRCTSPDLLSRCSRSSAEDQTQTNIWLLTKSGWIIQEFCAGSGRTSVVWMEFNQERSQELYQRFKHQYWRLQFFLNLKQSLCRMENSRTIMAECCWVVKHISSNTWRCFKGFRGLIFIYLIEGILRLYGGQFTGQKEDEHVFNNPGKCCCVS